MHRMFRGALPALALLAATTAASFPADESSPGADLTVPHLVERARFLATPARLERTIVLPEGPGRSGEPLRWELRIGDRQLATGRIAAAGGKAEGSSVVLSAPLPDISEPAGMDLVVELSRGGRLPLRSIFPFTLYPHDPGQAIVSLFNRSTVAIYDPAGSAGGILESLGFRVQSIISHEELLDAGADLIVVGTGGFARGQEALGPILAQRAADGTPLLLLDQPSLAATLTDRLRLWPSFDRGTETEYLLAAGHPALQGSFGSRGAAYLQSGEAPMSRPYLPPTRGNFRVLAGVRVKHGPAWQEGVGIVEFPIGRGTVVAAQTALASDYSSEPGARVLLINLLAYLLGEPPLLRQTFLYGQSGEALPACIAGLAPDAPSAPIDLQGVKLLMVPADWQAPRRRERAATAPPSDVARFLHSGGTVLLVDPQPLVADYLSAVLGEWVEFEPFRRATRDARLSEAAGKLPLLQGIGAEDLDLLRRPGEREFLLRSHRPNVRFEPILRVPGLSLYRVGRGSLVAMAMPRSVDCGSPRAASLLARLLTNLGVPLGVSGGENVTTMSAHGR